MTGEPVATVVDWVYVGENEFYVTVNGHVVETLYGNSEEAEDAVGKWEDILAPIFKEVFQRGYEEGRTGR